MLGNNGTGLMGLMGNLGNANAPGTGLMGSIGNLFMEGDSAVHHRLWQLLF